MNPPSKYQGLLFLNPRSPNGKRLQMRALRRHMHASEDKVPDPASKEMQGLGGQMAPNDAKGWTGPDRDDQGAKIWSVPHFDERGNPQAPSPQAGAGLSYTHPGEGHYDLPKEPQDNWNGEGTGRVEGSLEVGLARREKPDLGIEMGINTNKDFKEPLAAKDPFFSNRVEYQKELAKEQADFASQSFVIPSMPFPRPRPQYPQPAPASSVRIDGNFTPHPSSKPLPAPTLKPSREWVNKSGKPSDTLQYSPFVVPRPR